jgi:hypothetical protein
MLPEQKKRRLNPPAGGGRERTWGGYWVDRGGYDIITKANGIGSMGHGMCQQVRPALATSAFVPQPNPTLAAACPLCAALQRHASLRTPPRYALAEPQRDTRVKTLQGALRLVSVCPDCVKQHSASTGALTSCIHCTDPAPCLFPTIVPLPLPQPTLPSPVRFAAHHHPVYRIGKYKF